MCGCADFRMCVRPSVIYKVFFFVFFVYIDRCFSTLIHSNFIHREFLNFALHGYMQFFRLIQIVQSLTNTWKFILKHSSKKHSWFCLRKKHYMVTCNFFVSSKLFSLTKSHKYMKIYTFKRSSKKHSWFCLWKKSLRIRIGNEILLHTSSNM